MRASSQMTPPDPRVLPSREARGAAHPAYGSRVFDAGKRTIWIEYGLNSSCAVLSWSGGQGGQFSLELEFDGIGADGVDDDVTLRRWDGPLGSDGPAAMFAAVQECQTVAAELIAHHTGRTPTPRSPGTDRALQAVLAELEGRRGYPDRTTLIPTDSWDPPGPIEWILTRSEAFALVWPDGSEILAIPGTDILSRLLRRLLREPIPHGRPDRTRYPGYRGGVSGSEALKLPPDYSYEFRPWPRHYRPGPPTDR